jgi:hypothetical protein
VDGEHVYYVSSDGLLVHNGCFTKGEFGTKGPRTGDHHIATHYKSWGARFRKLFESCERSIHGKGNRVHLPGHAGPHSNDYHKAVYDFLKKAVGKKTGPDRSKALEGALEKLANKLLKNPDIPNSGF